jgi:hypothetical protein
MAGPSQKGQSTSVLAQGWDDTFPKRCGFGGTGPGDAMHPHHKLGPPGLPGATPPDPTHAKSIHDQLAWNCPRLTPFVIGRTFRGPTPLPSLTVLTRPSVLTDSPDLTGVWTGQDGAKAGAKRHRRLFWSRRQWIGLGELGRGGRPLRSRSSGEFRKDGSFKPRTGPALGALAPRRFAGNNPGRGAWYLLARGRLRCLPPTPVASGNCVNGSGHP